MDCRLHTDDEIALDKTVDTVQGDKQALMYLESAMRDHARL